MSDVTVVLRIALVGSLWDIAVGFESLGGCYFVVGCVVAPTGTVDEESWTARGGCVQSLLVAKLGEGARPARALLVVTIK